MSTSTTTATAATTTTTTYSADIIFFSIFTSAKEGKKIQ